MAMTRHKHTHTGLVTPSPLDHWIDAMLRVLAMLVSSVRSTLQMIIRRPPVNATQAMPADLPRETSDTNQETETAAPHSQRPTALMVSSTPSVRPSNHEGVLTTVSHTSPSPSVSRAPHAIHLPLPSRWRQAHRRNEGDIASTAEGGGGGSPRLRGETEGVARTTRKSRYPYMLEPALT